MHDGVPIEPARVLIEPERKMTDKDGWLTMKVKLNAPLEEIEQEVLWHLRINRRNPSRTRNRPDKAVEAL